MKVSFLCGFFAWVQRMLESSVSIISSGSSEDSRGEGETETSCSVVHVILNLIQDLSDN